ncbi:unnamed protein product [Paramecium pentaurelia]|uniref:Elongation factor 2 n=1 Tax=Paramecium pentaurelia TaxID=43138 RepID=A0A8S1Y989_9CILI|nr:unnamed protein product [Paramecium pentaurelia]
MVNLILNQITKSMNNQDNIRNICVFANMDHGRQTIIDQLLNKAGINLIDQSKEAIIINNTTPTNLSLYYEFENQSNGVIQQYLFNLIDFPRLPNFNSETILSSLRVSDGILIIVDYIEGISTSTESLLRMCMKEKVKPVLMVNKLDRAILELQQDSETIYNTLVQIIEQINMIIFGYQQDDMGDLLIKPEQGTVSFGSGKDGWALTCTKFAEFYASKFNTESKKLQEKFWGENYFDSETKCWVNENQSNIGKELKRTFVQFILDPICKMVKAIMDGNIQIVIKMLNVLGLQLNEQDQGLIGKQLLQTVMSKWINVSDNLIQMIIYHLPSPKQAQQYRTSYFYEGSQNNQVAQSIKNCNPNGPFVMFISKVIQVGRDNYIAFGRIFSGTIKQDQQIRIMGSNFKPCSKDDIFIRQIGKTAWINGRMVEYIEQGIPCGNVIGLIGDSNVLTNSSTISDHPECHLIRPIKNSVYPVVKMAISPKNPHELPKLIEGLRRLAQINQLIDYSIEDSGQHFISGCSEAHLQIALNELEDNLNGIQLDKSDPIVVYKETVTASSQIICMAKSENQHNRFYAQAVSLDENLQIAIEKGLITNNPQSRANILTYEYDWNKNEALKIWTFGPNDTGPNILCNQTTAVQYLNEIKESMQFAWQISTKEGALCQENMRGVRVNILDCVLSAETIYRGEGQIIPTARRLYSACELTAQPRLQEPILLTEVTVPNQVTAGVYQCLSIRKGIIIEEEQIVGTQLTRIKSYLSVAQSIGYSSHLRILTQGQAYPQCEFDHWAIIGGDPFEHGSLANELVLNIRKRKGLGNKLPNIDEYLNQS